MELRSEVVSRLEPRSTKSIAARPVTESRRGCGQKTVFKRHPESGAGGLRVGTIDLAIPRVRDGSYLPSLLEPRRRAERALLAVVQEAYVAGVSTRRVDDLVRALGIDGVSRSEVSRMCAGLDAELEAFRNRPLTDVAFPYLWLDACG